MKNKEKLWTGQFILLCVVSILNSAASQATAPLISGYTLSIGGSLRIAGIMVSLMSICGILLMPVSGLLADRFSCKRLIFCMLSFVMIANIGYSLARTVLLELIFRILHAVGAVFYSVAMSALVCKTVPKTRLSEGIGYHGILGSLGMIGSTVGMYLSERSYRTAFLFAAILLLIAAVLCCFVREKKAASVSQSSSLKRINFSDLFAPHLLPIMVVAGAIVMISGVVNSFLALLAEERKIAGAGMFFTIVAVAQAGLRPFVGKPAEKLGLKKVGIFSALLLVLEQIILAHVRSTAVLYLCAVIQAIGWVGVGPLMQAACVRLLPPEKVGLANSTYYLGTNMASALAPILGAWIAELFGYRIMFLVFAGITAMAVPVLFFSHIICRENEIARQERKTVV